MADTLTPNLGLLIADLNDTFNFGSHVEANFTAIDSLMGLVKCTSASRPSTTYGGQGIYETDTLRVAVNSGTKAAPVWTYVTSGVLAYTSSTRPSTNLFAGMMIYETDKDALVRWTGTVWKYCTLVVCTSSTRPTTGIAAGTGIYETDTTRCLVYNGSAWEQKSFGSFVCTSGTHPASPFTGLEIFETDTSRSLVYNGTAYIPQGATLMADPVTTSTSGTTATTTEVLDAVLGTYTFTAVAGRRYQVFYTGLKGGGTAGDLYSIRLRDGGASTPTNTSTLIAEGVWYCKATGGGGQDSVGVITDTFVAASSGVHTIGAFAVRNAGSGTFTPISGGTGRSIFVYDTGLT